METEDKIKRNKIKISNIQQKKKKKANAVLTIIVDVCTLKDKKKYWITIHKWRQKRSSLIELME